MLYKSVNEVCFASEIKSAIYPLILTNENELSNLFPHYFEASKANFY